MVAKPNEFPSGPNLSTGIVTGGFNKDPLDTTSNLSRAINPLTTPGAPGKQVPGNPRLVPFTQSALESNDHPPEPGTACAFFHTTGSPHDLFLGAFADSNQSGASPGNMDLMSAFPGLAQSMQEGVSKLVSQGFETKTEGGAEIRYPKDGAEWMHSLTRGIPTHAALFPLAGTVLESIKNIETAIQQFASALSQGMISQIPGTSISSLLSKLGGSGGGGGGGSNPISPEIQEGLSSIINLLQASSTSNTMALGGKVHETTFLENANSLISQCTTLGDICSVLHQLRYDTSLHGLDKLTPTLISSKSPWGTLYLNLDSAGTLQYANNVIPIVSGAGGSGGGGGNQSVFQAVQSFASSLASAAQNSGISNSDNLFKDQAQKIAEMAGRVPTEVGELIKQTLEQAMSGPHPDFLSNVKSRVPNGQLPTYFG